VQTKRSTQNQSQHKRCARRHVYAQLAIRRLASICLISLCVAGCVTGSAIGATTAASTPSVTEKAKATSKSGELLQAEVPQEWIQVVDRVVGNLAITEYVPGDTVDVWTEKLSYESLRRPDAPGAALPDPLEYSEGIAAQQEGRCEQFTDNVVFAGYENGYPTAVHMMQCGQSKLTGKPLLTMLKVIKGNDALYSITRIWRLGMEIGDAPLDTPSETDPEATSSSGTESPKTWNPATNPVPPTVQAEIAAWSQVLRRVQLCDHDLAAHRCAPEDHSVDSRG